MRWVCLSYAYKNVLTPYCRPLLSLAIKEKEKKKMSKTPLHPLMYVHINMLQTHFLLPILQFPSPFLGGGEEAAAEEVEEQRKRPFTITFLSSTFSSMASSRISILLFLHLLLISAAFSATFTIVNQCSHPVWPGILSNAGTEELSTAGFALQPGESSSLSLPASWSGRLWGRTLCAADSTGKFTCVTGDCGSGTLECSSGGAAPPATLAEFTLNGAGGLDFYDVSLVDGYNLPLSLAPQGGTGGNCTIAGCAADLNAACPSDLKVDNSYGGEGVACKSACEAFGDAQYCCRGEYATPDTCKPTSYSEYFKIACPRAYSYAYDDGSSTFTCASADYAITFCPSPATSQKSSGGQYPEAVEVSSAAANPFPSFTSIAAIAVATVVAIRQWR